MSRIPKAEKVFPAAVQFNGMSPSGGPAETRAWWVILNASWRLAASCAEQDGDLGEVEAQGQRLYLMLANAAAGVMPKTKAVPPSGTQDVLNAQMRRIKEYRERIGCSLKDARDAVAEDRDLPAPAPVAAPRCAACAKGIAQDSDPADAVWPEDRHTCNGSEEAPAPREAAPEDERCPACQGDPCEPDCKAREAAPCRYCGQLVCDGRCEGEP